jgi:hypothetical protein
VIFIGGNNIVSLIIAGVLSLSSALFHKVISLLIFYGFDLIKVYLNIINFGLKQLSIPEAQPITILSVLLSVYFIFGLLAAVIGRFMGKKANKLSYGDFEADRGLNESNNKGFFEIKEGQKTNPFLLLLHILAIPFGLYLFNLHDLAYGLYFVVPYMMIFGYVYSYSLRRLKKPIFWSQLLFIVLLSALFWKTDENSNFGFSLQGLIIGMEMMIRAMFIVVSFSALSVELRNEKVKLFLNRVGFGRFYQAIAMAFNALPQMISMLPKSGEIINSPSKSMIKPLVMAKQWLLEFEGKNGKGIS